MTAIGKLAAMAAALVSMTAAGFAQEFPARPVTIIVGNAAGSGTDFMVRTMQEKMAATLGQPVVIENVAAAGGIVASSTVAQAQPDGYTLLFVGTGPLVFNPLMGKDVPYNPIDDFTHVNLSTLQPAVMAVNPQVPGATLKEFIDEARANPGKYTYSSGGIGSPTHLVGELMELLYDLDMLHIPYQGSPAALTGVVSGEVSFNWGPTATVLPPSQDGRVKLLAHTLPKAHEALPGVPATAEVGMPELTVPLWSGFLAPKGTPDAVVAKLNEAINAALQDPTVANAFNSAGILILAGDGAAFTEQHRKDLQDWEGYLARMKIEP